jgi:transcriptional regulator with XRE-family HTH domain
MSKRSQQKLITQEARVLRHMRISKRYSLTKAGKLVGISGSAISHLEHGRFELSRRRIETLIDAYGYSKEQYLEFFDGRDLPINYLDECIALLRTCNEDKLKMLFPLVQNLTN